MRWVVKAYGLTPRWLSSRVVRLVNPSYLIGVAAIVFDDAGRLLMLRHTYHSPRWRLPGGLLDAGEQPFATAVRETAEEAQCVVRARTVVDATALKYSFDVAVLADLVSVQPFAESAEVVERRFAPESQWHVLRPDQRRFVELARPLWAQAQLQDHRPADKMKHD